jgi:hypothetical protein
MMVIATYRPAASLRAGVLQGGTPTVLRYPPKTPYVLKPPCSCPVSRRRRPGFLLGYSDLFAFRPLVLNGSRASAPLFSGRNRPDPVSFYEMADPGSLLFACYYRAGPTRSFDSSTRARHGVLRLCLGRAPIEWQSAQAEHLKARATMKSGQFGHLKNARNTEDSSQWS